MPVMGLDFAEGTTDNLALDTCGLKPTVEGTSGQWTSAAFSHPPEQVLGRVHHALSEGESQNITVELAVSSDGTSFGGFTAMTPNTLLPQGQAYLLRFSVTDACLSSVWVDVNDPSLSVVGRVFGSNDGIDADYSRWLVFVNDELVSNEPMTLGTFTHEWPIGAYLQPGSTSLTVMEPSVARSTSTSSSLSVRTRSFEPATTSTWPAVQTSVGWRTQTEESGVESVDGIGAWVYSFGYSKWLARERLDALHLARWTPY